MLVARVFSGMPPACDMAMQSQRYMEILAEKFPRCDYEWTDIRNKVWDFAKYAKKTGQKKKESKPKGVTKKSSKKNKNKNLRKIMIATQLSISAI